MENMTNSKWQIFTDAEKLDANTAFTLELQKAMLLALYENKKLNFRQYEEALALLEKKKATWDSVAAQSDTK